ncbi:OprD family outer membrane porin [Yersinia enterocolitica]|nr:OprD family outer membrane porin [Yersinia enterocolitica]
MVTHGAKRKTLALAVAGALLGTGFMAAPEAKAEGFVDDSSLTGGIYYWQRQRDRKDLTPGSAEYGKYVANLHHSTFNANLDFSSGYAADMFGIDLAAFGAVEMTNSGPAAPNEIGSSDAKTRWDEKWTGDKSGVSIYKAAAKFKLGDFWARGGYIQPTGQTLLAPHWSFMPGTYRGAEGGAKFDFDTAGHCPCHTCGLMNIKRRGIRTCTTSVKLMAKLVSVICTQLVPNMTLKTS